MGFRGTVTSGTHRVDGDGYGDYRRRTTLVTGGDSTSAETKRRVERLVRKSPRKRTGRSKESRDRSLVGKEKDM